MTFLPRVDVETRRAIQSLRDSADQRLTGRPAPAMTAVEGEEPMICNEWEATPDGTEQQRP